MTRAARRNLTGYVVSRPLVFCALHTGAMTDRCPPAAKRPTATDDRAENRAGDDVTRIVHAEVDATCCQSGCEDRKCLTGPRTHQGPERRRRRERRGGMGRGKAQLRRRRHERWTICRRGPGATDQVLEQEPGPVGGEHIADGPQPRAPPRSIKCDTDRGEHEPDPPVLAGAREVRDGVIQRRIDARAAPGHRIEKPLLGPDKPCERHCRL